MITFIRSVIYEIHFIVCALGFSMVLSVLPQRFLMAGVRLWMLSIVKGAEILCGIKYRVEGMENLPKDRPFIIASNHQSAYETFLYWLLFNEPAFILKQSLARIPFVGWALLREGCIAIDRKAGMSAMMKTLSGSEKRLKEGQSVIIFPEGTRVRPGEKVPFHSGIALMYAKLDAPVIPVAVNSANVWGKNSLIKRPGTVTVKVMPAIPAGLPKKEFLTLLENTVDAGRRDIG